MEILISYTSFEGFEEKYKQLIADAATEAISFDGRIKNAEVSISIVTSDEIQRLNKRYRGMDSVTDVLSFPLYREIAPNHTDEVIVIGDIIICLDRVMSQAYDYGHSFDRELAFLTVHGTLHLLGYDHINEDDENVMLSMQKRIMERLDLERAILSSPSASRNRRLSRDSKPQKGAKMSFKDFFLKSKGRFIVYALIVGIIACGLVLGITSVLLSNETEPVIALIPDDEPTFIPLPEIEPEEEDEEEIEPNFEGMARSHLTGLYINEDAVSRRPFAVTINNMRQALPQSGISQASLIYAVQAEGGITRLVAVFDDFDSEKIGPVRSARDYFLSFAYDSNAIYVHHGGSPNGYESLTRLGTDNLDGMRLEGSVFFRDRDRYQIPSMREHSSYTSAERLIEASERFETVQPDGFENRMFDFYDEPTKPNGADSATEITVPFSTSYPITFKYDAETELYSVFERQNEQMDIESGEQLTTTNIIVQLTTLSVIPGDRDGRLNVTTTGSGEGYIITNGGYAPITWQKSEINGQVQFFGADGKKLNVNRGKTWICVHNGRVDFE
jgi:rRNA maturation RNase YbeY